MADGLWFQFHPHLIKNGDPFHAFFCKLFWTVVFVTLTGDNLFNAVRDAIEKLANVYGAEAMEFKWGLIVSPETKKAST